MALITSQQALNDQYAAEAAEVERLNQQRLAKGQAYNALAQNIKTLEEAGVAVDAAMYAQLDALELQYQQASESFGTAAAELQKKVDPTWYQELNTTLMSAWDSVSSAASSAYEGLQNTFNDVKGWFSKQIMKFDEAFGVSEKVGDAVTYVTEKAAEVGQAVVDTVSDVADAVDGNITAVAATVGLDDEYQQAKDAVAEGAQAVADGVRETAESIQETATHIADTVSQGVDLSDGIDKEDLENLAGNVSQLADEATQKAQEAVDAASAKVNEVVENLKETELGQKVMEGAEVVGEAYDSAKDAVADAAQAGIEKLGLEEEVEAVGEAIDATQEAITEVADEIKDGLGSMADSIKDSVGGWWDSWWSDDDNEQVPNGGRPAVDGAGRTIHSPNLRPGNPHTEIDVDTGDASERRDAMIRAMDAQGITDPAHRAAMMAQAHHETGGFEASEENFNYSGRRLFELYGAGNEYGNRVRFNSVDEANALVAQGKSAVGDVIYGGRMGNDEVGDGYKFRGRGAFQLTGKDNYSRYSQQLFGDDRLVQNPELVMDPEIGAQVAAAYYQENVVNRGIAGTDTRAVSRAINGGTIGLQHRMDLTAAYQNDASIGVGAAGASGILAEGIDTTGLAEVAEVSPTSPQGIPMTPDAGLLAAQASVSASEREASANPAPAPVIVQGGGSAPPMIAQGNGGGAGGQSVIPPVGYLSPEDIMMMYGTNQGIGMAG
jgi:predicted chitinase